MKYAYQVTFFGQKLYFDYTYAGLKAIQKLAYDYNTGIPCKVVSVDNTRQLITL